MIPTSTGGLGGTAITFLLDDSESSDPAEGANKIAIATAGNSDAAKAALLIKAINGTTDSLIDYASSGNGQAGYDIGVTAAEGTSDTQITLTMDTAGAAGNISSVLASVSGVNIIDVTAFTGGVSNIEVINAITLLRNGPYQWPTWKQIRTGEHAIARYQRRNNILSITTEPDRIFTPNEGDTVIPEQMGGKLRQFTEAPITSKYKPIYHILGSVRPTALGALSGIKYTHANNKDMFSNDEINYTLNLKNNFEGDYKKSAGSYILPTAAGAASKLRLLSYRETVYPQPENAYLSGSRSRLTFVHPEWRFSREDRKETSSANSMIQVVASQSTWPLDARGDFATATIDSPGTGSGAGELQNGYTIFHNGVNLGSSTTSTKSVKFGKRAYLTASITHSRTALNLTYLSQSVISLWFKAKNSSWNPGTQGSSLVSKGRKNTTGVSDKMTYDLRLKGGDLYANVGYERGDSDNEISYTGGSLADDGWHHVALAWYWLSPSDHKMSLYVDGERRAAGSTGTGTGSVMGDIGTAVVIGANPPDDATQANQVASLGWRGSIDEITFFTGSLYANGTWTDDTVTTLYNDGNPIDVISSSLANLAVISHYRMGEDTSDGPLGKYTGFIQDVSIGGLTLANNLTGNLSASVTNDDREGFASQGDGIFTDAPYNPLYMLDRFQKEIQPSEQNSAILPATLCGRPQLRPGKSPSIIHMTTIGRSSAVWQRIIL